MLCVCVGTVYVCVFSKSKSAMVLGLGFDLAVK